MGKNVDYLLSEECKESVVDALYTLSRTEAHEVRRGLRVIAELIDLAEPIDSDYPEAESFGMRRFLPVLSEAIKQGTRGAEFGGEALAATFRKFAFGVLLEHNTHLSRSEISDIEQDLQLMQNLVIEIATSERLGSSWDEPPTCARER